ncbi:PAS domain-containing sensor histidine kinase [Sphingomonas sp.]|uniref:hybrid sensor histidine kinase/response regulator n=1 Tax=Sphingomonas sp. TaxID=28214 RepID=UPI0025F74798|nr:PAS domain-containing sensor histidine kinase [Sphingomonas sp.]
MSEPIADDPFRLLVQSVVDYAIYMLDTSGHVTSWNAGAERIKGFATHEILGKHFSTFYTDEDRAAGLPGRALETARSEGRYEADGWRVRKDGTRFWASVVMDAIKNDSGKLVGFAKITRDMTEKRQVQQALMESERRFRILVQGVTDYALFMLDPEGRVANWNSGAERIKGYSPEDIVGEHFSRFYTAEDFEAGVPFKAIETARRVGRYEAEGWRVRKDGTRFWASVVLDAIRDDEGELLGFAKITRDMTDKREAQLRLEESREQLFRSQKMEALGQLTGGLAHDFNNLLTAILGASDLALRNIDNEEKLRRMIDGIRNSAQRGAGLTKQLLAFARAQPLEINQIELKGFLDEVTTLLRPSLRSDIEVILEISDQLWPVDADAGALELALLNLAFNARDSMKSGGKLKLSATNEVLSGQPDGLHGEHVALRVSDTGHGMDRATMERVFEPFFTTKTFGEGTGLGLSQVFGFVKQLGGTVTITSEVNKGSTFTIYIPASHGSGERAQTDGAADRKLTLGRVLIVEDDMIVAELAAGMLDELGFEPTIVHSAKEALDRLASGEKPKLIFSDIIMPGGISGLELARKVRARFPELPILLTTGYSEQASGTHGFPVLQKPYEFDSLSDALQDLLKQDITLQ